MIKEAAKFIDYIDVEYIDSDIASYIVEKLGDGEYYWPSAIGIDLEISDLEEAISIMFDEIKMPITSSKFKINPVSKKFKGNIQLTQEKLDDLYFKLNDLQSYESHFGLVNSYGADNEGLEKANKKQAAEVKTLLRKFGRLLNKVVEFYQLNKFYFMLIKIQNQIAEHASKDESILKKDVSFYLESADEDWSLLLKSCLDDDNCDLIDAVIDIGQLSDNIEKMVLAKELTPAQKKCQQSMERFIEIDDIESQYEDIKEVCGEIYALT